MVRKILNDEQWARIAPELPGKKGDPGKSGTDNRLFVEAVLWVARTGSPWRDPPDDFGKWSTVYTRYWRWAQKDKWESIFKRLSEDADFEYVMIDGTIVRVHQHGAGARGDTKSGYRPLVRRLDDQDRDFGGRAWKPGALHLVARPASRHQVGR